MVGKKGEIEDGEIVQVYAYIKVYTCLFRKPDGTTCGKQFSSQSALNTHCKAAHGGSAGTCGQY